MVCHAADACDLTTPGRVRPSPDPALPDRNAQAIPTKALRAVTGNCRRKDDAVLFITVRNTHNKNYVYSTMLPRKPPHSHRIAVFQRTRIKDYPKSHVDLVGLRHNNL